MVDAVQKDVLYRGTCCAGKIRFSAVDAFQTCNDAILIHNTDPLSGFYFSQTLIGTLLCVPLMKGKQSTVIRWDYAGALGKIVTEVSSDARIRAISYAPNISESVTCSEDILGETGTLSVMRIDNVSGKVLNQGTASACLMDPVPDLAFFFCTSDQVETEMGAIVAFNPDPHVPIRVARGVLLQAMPEMDLTLFEQFRSRLDINSMLTWNDFSESTLRAYLEKICECDDVVFLDSVQPRYGCSCERDRMISSVKTLAKSDIDHVFGTDETIALECQYCKKKYHISRDELSPKS